MIGGCCDARRARRRRAHRPANARGADGTVGVAAVAPLIRLVVAGMLIQALPSAAVAQEAGTGNDPAHRHATPSGHVHAADREIKSLSADEERALLAGEGMGLALAAELNGYPGPRHVLELGAELELSGQQRAAMERIRERMTASARELGHRVVHLERELDRAFAEGRITGPETTRRSEEIGRLRGRLRAVHLRAHLETAALLSAEQRARYQALRGYDASPD